jgi:curved DNA-binding protein
MKFKDYYETLGLLRNATQDEVKRAYRRLARKYHPDVSKEPEAEARFKEVGEAYEVLKDPEKRAAYDQFGKDWKAGQEFRPPPDWDANFEFSGRGFGGSGFSDFFETLFGGTHGRGPGASPFGDMGGGFRGAARRMRGEDHHARIVVSLEEAYAGATKTLTLRAPRVDTEGHVETNERSVRVKIPQGVRAGQRIRLAGQGSSGAAGGRAGDLFLEVVIQPHRYFRLDGADVLLDLPVAQWEAALGATVQVPTLGGRVDLKIPPGSQSGSKLRLRGRGLSGATAGDQIVILQIEVPPADTDARRGLYEQMRRDMPFDPRARLRA